MSSLAPAETMPCWYYDKKDIRGNTPSIRDGVDPEMEIRFRKEGARFITNTGNKMGLRHYETLATGIVYFHRFYMIHSFKQFPHYVTACCCLFLAGKVEETPKKCKDIIKAARSLLNDQQFAQFGQDPQEEVMTLERILLQTMKFDLQVDHPYKYLLRYAKCLKGDQQKLENMVQMAWTFVNDSLLTTLCLQWEPEIIAIALIYLATKLKFEVLDWNGRLPKHQGWWDMYVEDITIELLEDVCHQVLDLYSNNAKSESPTPTTPPHPPKPGQIKLADLNSSQVKRSKTTSPMTPVGPHPPKTPVETPKMEPMILDPNLQMQGPILTAPPSEPPVHMNVMHGYNYVTSMPGMPEGFAPTQYIPSPNNPYANFGDMGLQAQSVVDRPYPPGYYEVGAYPPRFPQGAPPPMPPQYSGAVPVHYMTEPPGFAGGRPPTQPGQFPGGVFMPGAYPAPGFAGSPVPTRPVHQALMRGGGVARLPNRHPAHPNWGV